MEKYYKEVDVLKGIAIVMVLLVHSIILYPINLLDYSWCKVLFEYTKIIPMELFFLVSGFCYSKKGKYKEYISSKVKRILIPYITFSLIDLIPRHLFPQLINGKESISESINSIVLYGGKFWFLYTLFAIFIIYPLFEKYIKEKYIVMGVIICLILIELLPITDVFLLNSIIKYLKYFIIGNYIRKIYNSDLKVIVRKPLILLFSILAYILLIMLPDTSYFNFLKSSMGIIMLYVICCYIIKYKITNMLTDFGKYSLQIYLVNGYMLVLARYTTVNLLNIRSPFIIIGLIFISNVSGGIIISKYILNRNKITKFISGIPIKQK